MGRFIDLLRDGHARPGSVSALLGPPAAPDRAALPGLWQVARGGRPAPAPRSVPPPAPPGRGRGRRAVAQAADPRGGLPVAVLAVLLVGGIVVLLGSVGVGVYLLVRPAG